MCICQSEGFSSVIFNCKKSIKHTKAKNSRYIYFNSLGLKCFDRTVFTAFTRNFKKKNLLNLARFCLNHWNPIELYIFLQT